jgi:drug/metabolite transporter (DMT)-like permease
MPAHRKAILFLIIAHVIWGAAYPVYKWALADVPPFTFVFFRFFFAAYLFLPFVYKNITFDKKDFWDFFWLSMSGITLGISLMFIGLQHTSSINAPIILSSGPVFLLIYAIWARQKVRDNDIIGTVIALLGVLVIVLKPIFTEGFDGSLLGNGLLLLSSLIGVWNFILFKKLIKKYSIMLVNFWMFVIGTIPLFPLVVHEMTTHSIHHIFMPQGLIGIFYGCVLATTVAYILSSYSIKILSTTEYGVFGYTDPIATVLVAIPLLGEVVTLPYVIGAGFILVGVYITEHRLAWHPLHLLQKSE